MPGREPGNTSQRESLRVAIVGYGLAGSVFHAPLVAATRGLEVAAIVTSNPERRDRVERDFPHATLLDSTDEIWRTADHFDLLVVATPNRFHAPLAATALRHGIPVVIDKPLALSVDEGGALIVAGEETGVPFTCFQNRRWDGDFLTVRQLLRDNPLGPVTRFESRFERYRPAVRPGSWREETPWEEGGGLLWDLGSHLIDQALLLFGEPVQVYAEMARRRPGATVDDDTFVALTFDQGVIAHLWMSVSARLPGPRFRLQGLHGAFEKFGLDSQEEALRAGKRPNGAGWGAESRAAWGRLVTDVNGLAIDAVVETLAGSYPQFYAGVRDALLEEAQWPVDPRSVLITLRVIEAARKSAQTGTTIHL